jgi:hypothetical protein
MRGQKLITNSRCSGQTLFTAAQRRTCKHGFFFGPGNFLQFEVSYVCQTDAAKFGCTLAGQTRELILLLPSESGMPTQHQSEGIIMRTGVGLLVFFLAGMTSHAQTFDLLDSFSSDNTFIYTRTGIPSTFMGGDTSSQFTEFDGLITINGDARETPDGMAIMHALTITRRGLETVRTSRRIVSQQSVTVIEADTLYEFLNGSEGCGSLPLRGWMFPDTTWNSPPCPNMPDTLRLYPYGQYYRFYTPAPSDSFDVADGVLRLRTLRTDCLDYAQQLEFRIERHGLAEILRSEFNFFDWSSDERWRRTVTPGVEDSRQHPKVLTVTAHPNPAREYLSIHIAADQGGPFNVLLHDIHGRVLATSHDSMHENLAPDVTFDLRSFNSGMYFCTVLTATGAKTVPIIVLRGK